jgi:acyl-CoA synthetase (AMP-forming)/AMP-acid ligase II
MERWDPAEAFRLIERERVTVLSGIPTHFIDLLNHEALETADVSSLKTGWIGGANNPPEVIEAIAQRLGMKGILPVYGMTETTSITTIPKLDEPPEVIKSGKGFPVSDFELKVIDTVTGAELDAGAEGEVCVRGHLVMQGYYENPEATAEVIDADGWFHTGDLGVLDEDGYLAITGRKSDMFIVGGSNAYPAEIERALSEHPALRRRRPRPAPRRGRLRVRRAAPRRRARPRRRDRVLPQPPRRLQGPAPRRVRHRVAADRDRQDPALPAARAGRGGRARALALRAWTLGRPGVTSLIVGARTEEQLADNLAAADLELSEAERARLDELSAPPLLYPFWHQAQTAADRLGPADLTLLGPHVPAG